MKIEITINKITPERLRLILVVGLVLASVLLWTQMGFATWLLLLAFCLMVLAIGLLWVSVTTAGDDQGVTLGEALDMAAPARDEERKLAVLRGIKDLDYERSLGKISEQDYQQISQRYRKEAKRLLARLDTSEASLRQRAIDLASQIIEPAPTPVIEPPKPAVSEGTKRPDRDAGSSDSAPAKDSENGPDRDAESTDPAPAKDSEV